MIISKIKVKNFRSIRELEFQTNSLVVLLGPNNHGKSNLVKAISFALSTSAKVDLSDFFAFKQDEEEIRSNEMWVEITFEDLTEQEQATLAKYLLSDGSVCVRKFATISDDGNIETGYKGYVDSPEEWWLQSDPGHCVQCPVPSEEQAGRGVWLPRAQPEV